MDLSRIPEYVMNTLCRICAEKTTNLVPIFKDELFPHKILKCLPIKVSVTDDLPLNVCESCFRRINESYSLYETALKSNERLKKLWRILLKETIVTRRSGDGGQGEALPGVKDPLKDGNQKDDVENVDDVVLVGKAIVVEIVTKSNEMASLKGNEEEEKQRNNEKDFESSTGLSVDEQKVLQSVSGNDGKEKGDAKVKGKVYQCQFCFRQLTSSASLSIHESTHSQQRPFLCDTCGKSFKHANNLRCHVRTHLGVKKKYSCKICSKEFVTKFFLTEHMNSHTGETPYKCDICSKEFREKVHLRQHKWSHSSEKFTCDICGSKFNRKGNMREHIKKYHRNTMEVETTTSQIEKNESVLSKALLSKGNSKGEAEEKRFSCSMCGKKFRHSGSLTYHRRTSHTGEKPFQCSYCSEKFSLRSVQRIHERKIHTFERPYKCSCCSRMFANSSSLRNHLFVHSKEKMFQCKECGKKFTRSSNLAVHGKIHAGERRFECDQCGKRYIQRYDLMKHMKNHDAKSKPFFCKYCGNSFSRKRDAAKHSTCQFDSFRKFNTESCSAEKMLDSVSIAFHEGTVEEFFHQENDIIMASVAEISGENVTDCDGRTLG